MTRSSASRPEKDKSFSEEDEPQHHPHAEEESEEEEEESSSSGEEEEEIEEDGVAEQREQPISQPEKKNLRSPSSKSSPATLKRHVEAEPSGNSSKRAKKDVYAKKSAFQRFWSEEAETAILQGIIDYVREKGVVPRRDFDSFCGFMQDLLGISIKKTQLMDKISRLKKKYENNSGKARKFSDPHDEKLYDLSCQIWADEGVLGKAKSSGTVRKNRREGKDILVETKEGLHLTGMSGINEMIALHKFMEGEKLDEGFIKEGWTLLDAEQRIKFESRWTQLQLEEWELHMKRIGLVHEEAQCISKAFKSKLG